MKLLCCGLVCVIAVASSFSGCAKKSDSDVGKQPKSIQTATQTDSSQAVTKQESPKSNSADFNLVGVWLGTSYLDEQALEEQLAALPDDQARQQLAAKAETFYSMWMAAQFNPDQSLELDMEITLPNGELLNDQAYGTWSAECGKENTLIVTTVEHRGTVSETSTKEYLIVDENHFSIEPAVAEELKKLHPFVMFQRQIDEAVELMPEAETENLK